MTDDQIMRLVTPYGYRHPQLVSRIRIGVGVWLLTLTVILSSYGVGSWCGVVLIPAAVLCFYLAYREPRTVRASKASTHTD
jgi:hypothetical protein